MPNQLFHHLSDMLPLYHQSLEPVALSTVSCWPRFIGRRRLGGTDDVALMLRHCRQGDTITLTAVALEQMIMNLII